jgi:hypothetical protein
MLDTAVPIDKHPMKLAAAVNAAVNAAINVAVHAAVKESP